MKNKHGFTLVELLIAIAIIGVLATLGTLAASFARTRASVTKAQHDLDAIYTSMNMLANDTNVWPGHQPIDTTNNVANNEICATGCTYGIADPEAGIVDTDGTYPGWNGPYMIQIKPDPWNHEYFFDTDYSVNPDSNPCGPSGVGCSLAAVLGSAGPDGLYDPSGNDADNSDDIIKIIAR